MHIVPRIRGSFLPFLLILFVFLIPVTLFAQPGVDSQIVPDCGASGMCGYCDLLTLAQNIMNFLVFIAVIISVLLFVHAGFLLLTGGSSEAKRTQAKKIFFAVVLGLILTLAAWLIVDAIMAAFLNQSIGDRWTLPGCGGNVSA